MEAESLAPSGEVCLPSRHRPQTQDDARRFFAIARGPKEQLTYAADHFFAEAPEAQGNCRRWLGEKLGFAR